MNEHAPNVYCVTPTLEPQSDLRGLVRSIYDEGILSGVKLPLLYANQKESSHVCACFDTIGLVEPRDTNETPISNTMNRQQGSGLLGVKMNKSSRIHDENDQKRKIVLSILSATE